ncbi:hypothetical protein [Labrenzia sp. THAF82]|uniref:hypothetical protein n=1 Tax=Labrenzia sp. THAF82 TaxID=2587861 RepID=UPI00126918C2|nr:hypothetical protein [Labrenzia sp. THAF82]
MQAPAFRPYQSKLTDVAYLVYLFCSYHFCKTDSIEHQGKMPVFQQHEFGPLEAPVETVISGQERLATPISKFPAHADTIACAGLQETQE